MSELPLFSYQGVQAKLYLYDDKIHIVRKGALNGFGSSAPYGERTVSLSSVAGVSVRKPQFLSTGFLRINVIGTPAPTNEGFFALQKDWYAVSIRGEAGFYEGALEFARAVERQLLAYKQPQADSSGRSKSGVSVADELKKLAELRDLGVLTEREFESQKAKLLKD